MAVARPRQGRCKPPFSLIETFRSYTDTLVNKKVTLQGKNLDRETG
jgi:hypothetical protein